MHEQESVDPVEHALYLITEHPAMDPAIHFIYNQECFKTAGFCIFFIAQLAAIRPIYSIMSRALVTLDAGYMGQLLQSRQAEFEIGLCPVGGVDVERIRMLFNLGPEHIFIHCLLGGPHAASYFSHAKPLSSHYIKPFFKFFMQIGGETINHQKSKIVLAI